MKLKLSYAIRQILIDSDRFSAWLSSRLDLVWLDQYNIAGNKSMNNNLKIAIQPNHNDFQEDDLSPANVFSCFNFHQFVFLFYVGIQKLNFSNNRISHRISIDSWLIACIFILFSITINWFQLGKVSSDALSRYLIAREHKLASFTLKTHLRVNKNARGYKSKTG